MLNELYIKQISFPRVKEAFEQKKAEIVRSINSIGINYPPSEAYIRVFKYEKLLELWVKGSEDSVFTCLKKYAMTGFSGMLGPKRMEGDGQIPEGFYSINRLNPLSKYHLSIGIDYPNQVDRVANDNCNPGKDIFIHGGDKTVGCVPIGDENIKELYIIVLSVDNPFNTKVHIFPSRLDDMQFTYLKDKYRTNQRLISFWSNLKEGYDLFELHGRFAYTAADSGGRYVFI